MPMRRALMCDAAELTRSGGRDQNQDACGSERVGRATCWVLADGLGGHRGGEVAARRAVAGALEAFREKPEVSRATIARMVARANQAVLDAQRENPALARMRSTLVVLVADLQHVVWGHVGDARLYRFEGGRLRHRTRDHSVVQALVDAGEITPRDQATHEDRNRLLRVIGDPAGVEPTTPAGPERLRQGDAFLLCSDGLWEAVSDLAMEIDLAGSASAAGWLERLERRVSMRVGPGSDNYSAVAVRFDDHIVVLPPARSAAERTGPALDTAAAPPASSPTVRLGRFVGPAVLATILIAGMAIWPRIAPERAAPAADPAEGADALAPGMIRITGMPEIYDDLDAAMSAAPEGGAIRIGPGRYRVTATHIARAVSLRGAGQAHTTIDLTGTEGLAITADAGRLTDLAICCAGGDAALALGGAFAGVVARVAVSSEARIGLLIRDRARPTIERVSISDHADGKIRVEDEAEPRFVDTPDAPPRENQP
jgi:serine/threonine protein phosphatase PrpC